MHLLLLQLLAILPLGEAAGHGHQSQSSVSLVFLERSRRELPLGHPEEAEEKPDLFVAVPHLVGASAGVEGQRQREKTLLRFSRLWKKPERELNLDPTQDPAGEHFPLGTQALTHSKDGTPMKKSPLQEEAKKFWHHFMFRMRPASQGVILPIKSHEVHQEMCRTVPFSQTIAHEDCEEVVVQNHLCFGKCGSAHLPEAAQRRHVLCSHCLPAKFAMTHLTLNCTGLAPVVKEVMLVEECQCKVKTEQQEHGHLLQAGSRAEFHSQEPFIPEFSA